MDKYVVNKRAQNKSGCHKIHTSTCVRAPEKNNQIELGKCMCPIEAKSRAKEYFEVVNIVAMKFFSKKIRNKEMR